jgi:Abortive infection alpha
MADEDKLVKAGVEAAMKPFADLLDKLAGPAAEEIGLTLKDHVRVFRLKRQIRLFSRVKEMLAESSIEPGRVPLKLLLPMVENASIEENDDLQDRWAAMLANAAVNRDIHPSFPEILKQLSEKEVAYLDACYRYTEGKHQLAHDKNAHGAESQKRYGELDNQFLLDLGWLLDFTGENPQAVFRQLEEKLKRSGFQSNVIRLGLMRTASRDLNHRLTDFAEAFVKACRPPESCKS